MFKINKYKFLFYLIFTLNFLTCFLLFLNRNEIIPLYKRITRLYISYKQGTIYDFENKNLNNELTETKGQTLSIKGLINKNPSFKNKVKITFIGNSIALSMPNKEKSWNNMWGMAATKKDNAYPQLISKKIAENLNYKVSYSVYNLASIAQKRKFPNSLIDEINLNRPDVLIIQLGDNVSRKNLNIFSKDLEFFLSKLPNTQCSILTTPFYPDELKNNIFVEISSKLGFYLVDLSNLISSSDNPSKLLAESEKFYFNPGVRAHPGDYGMLKIAMQIYPTVKSCLSE
tara:strand:+ start:3967 stop:4824 length:858 start_codon:yes stop_codon:yes gene_type:complete